MPELDVQPGNGLRAVPAAYGEVSTTHSTSFVWATDAQGLVHRPVPSWGEFTGQAYDEYAGSGWLAAVHPDDRARVARDWQACVRAGHSIELAYRLRRHDGQYRQIRAHGAAMIADGRVCEWFGVCVDITASLQGASALRQSEERFRFLDRLGQATRTLTDANEVMQATSRLLGEYLGATRCAYADVEADGNTFTIRSDWSAPGVPSSVGIYSLDLFGPRAAEGLRRGEQVVLCDVDELGEDGGARMFRSIGIRAVMCTGLVKDGRLAAMMAVHQATPREWTAREAALVQDVVERCWAHIERVRDNAVLREQDRRKDEFLATLAHELRNPLAPIKYAVQMMRLAPEPASNQRAQGVIDRQVSQMSRLIDDLLDLSRINLGLIQLQREPVRLRTLLERAVETARPAIESARHELHVQWPREDLVVHADPARIIQVIGNLLNNAAKYTPDGGRIDVKAWAEGGHAHVEVRDNGIGIPADQQAKLFQMFSQLDHDAARGKGGLGVGLALVQRIVQMHGGQVHVHSDGQDEGTTVSVQVPLPAQDAPAEREDAGAEAGPAPGGRRVLVVEDNRDGLETLLALLDMLGYEVCGAADGREALERAREFQPQVVLLDLGLPVMDGLEVARALRQDETLSDVYIAALTGWGAESDRRRTAEAGFDAHLTKPVELAALEDVLGRAAARA